MRVSTRISMNTGLSAAESHESMRLSMGGHLSMGMGMGTTMSWNKDEGVTVYELASEYEFNHKF